VIEIFFSELNTKITEEKMFDKYLFKGWIAVIQYS